MISYTNETQGKCTIRSCTQHRIHDTSHNLSIRRYSHHFLIQLCCGSLIAGQFHTFADGRVDWFARYHIKYFKHSFQNKTHVIKSITCLNDQGLSLCQEHILSHSCLSFWILTFTTVWFHLWLPIHHRWSTCNLNIMTNTNYYSHCI